VTFFIPNNNRNSPEPYLKGKVRKKKKKKKKKKKTERKGKSCTNRAPLGRGKN